MDNKLVLLFLLAIAVVFAVDDKNNDEKNVGSGVVEDEDEQGSGKDNVVIKEENGKTRAASLVLQQRYWPLCEQLRKCVPQLCLRQSVAGKCTNVCNNMEPELDCGIKIPPNPSKKKNKKKQLKLNKQRKTMKQLKKKVTKGKTDKGVKRIVGGKISIKNEWNWQVFLEGASSNGKTYECGGAILTKNFILTAGHCVDKPGLLNSPNRWKVYVGDHIKYVPEGTDAVHKVKHIMRHNNYGSFMGKPTSDVAIFQLEDAIDIEDENKGRICLPDEDKPIPDQDKTCYVTGWGVTTSGKASDLLKHAPVLMVPRDVCNLPQSWGGNIDETMFCAGDIQTGETDSCFGDSGGSLACKMGVGLNARWYSSGVVSWGEEPTCTVRNKYGVYSNTTYFKDWIVDTILEQSKDL